PALLCKRSAIVLVLQNAEQDVSQVALPLRGKECQSRFGDRRRRFRSSGRDHRQAAGNPSDCAAAPRGNMSAHKQQNVGNGKAAHYVFSGQDAHHVEFNTSILKPLLQFRLGALRITAKNNQPQISNTRGGELDGINDLVNFPSSGFPAGDAKDRDAQLSAGENTLSRVGLAGRGQIRSDGNEASFAKLVPEPGNSLYGNRENGSVANAQRCAHGAQLQSAAQAVKHSCSAVGLDVVKHDSNADLSGFQYLKKPGKSQRKTAR